MCIGPRRMQSRAIGQDGGQRIRHITYLDMVCDRNVTIELLELLEE
jgi:hypothetical protein